MGIPPLRWLNPHRAALLPAPARLPTRFMIRDILSPSRAGVAGARHPPGSGSGTQGSSGILRALRRSGAALGVEAALSPGGGWRRLAAPRASRGRGPPQERVRGGGVAGEAWGLGHRDGEEAWRAAGEGARRLPPAVPTDFTRTSTCSSTVQAPGAGSPGAALGISSVSSISPSRGCSAATGSGDGGSARSTPGGGRRHSPGWVAVIPGARGEARQHLPARQVLACARRSFGGGQTQAVLGTLRAPFLRGVLLLLQLRDLGFPRTPFLTRLRLGLPLKPPAPPGPSILCAEEQRDAERDAPGPRQGISVSSRAGIGPEESLKLPSHTPPCRHTASQTRAPGLAMANGSVGHAPSGSPSD